ncbi:MAG: hypothetical protein NC935_03460 [Candidatus Omnitrophica bacterium]|nr:hypothetical protein [Candidatus Omnitrophota bacterium]
MGLYQTKFWFRNKFKNLTKYFIWLNPDILSYSAIGVALFTGVCIYYSAYNAQLLLFSFAFIILRMVLNTLDGMIAIAQRKKTAIGEIVNALPDRYADIFTMLGVAFCPLTNKILGMIAVISILLVSYTGMLGKAVGVSWQHQGPAGKVDRLFALLIAIILQYYFLIKGFNSIKIFNLKMSVFDWLSLWFIFGSQITILNRLKGMIKEIKEKESA